LNHLTTHSYVNGSLMSLNGHLLTHK